MHVQAPLWGTTAAGRRPGTLQRPRQRSRRRPRRRLRRR